MTDETYRYDRADPRRDRTHYMYSAYAGPAFVAAYRARRVELADRLAALPNTRTAPENSVREVPRPGSRKVSTPAVLRACSAITTSDDRVRAWVDILGRKFEFAHRLRAAYGADLRPTTTVETPPDGYALLAHLVARTSGAEDLRSLNTLLKLNDLLSVLVAGGALTDGTAIAAAREAVREEGRRVVLWAERAGADVRAEPT